MFICTAKEAKAGTLSYRQQYDPPPGRAAVYDARNSTLATYHVPRGRRRAFRRWLAEVYAYRLSFCRVTGRYPEYTIESEA